MNGDGLADEDAHRTPLYQGHGKTLEDYERLGPAPQEVARVVAAVIVYKIIRNPVAFMENYEEYKDKKRRRERKANHALAEGLA